MDDLHGCDGNREYAMCLVGEQRPLTLQCSILNFNTLSNEWAIELKRDLVTSTAALAGLSSIVFGFLTNLPVALGYVSIPYAFHL